VRLAGATRSVSQLKNISNLISIHEIHVSEHPKNNFSKIIFLQGCVELYAVTSHRPSCSHILPLPVTQIQTYIQIAMTALALLHNLV